MTITKQNRFFYGWVVLGTAFLLMGVVGGGVYYAFGVFFKPMITELGWSRGIGSLAFSIMMLMGAVSGPIIGAAVVRFGARKLIVLGNLVIIGAFILLSKTSQPWHLFLVYGVICGMAMGAEAGIPATAMINNWFIKKRGLALGIAMTGVGVGTFILAPTIRYLIENIGWRSSWLALAGIAFVFALLPGLIFARTTPEEMNQLPDGAKLQRGDANQKTTKVNAAYKDWEVKEALRTPSFWLIVAFMCSNMFAINMLATHQVAHLEDIGISPVVAAGALGLLVVTSSIGRLAGGSLGDKIEPRFIGASACGLQVIGLLIFSHAKTLGLIYTYVVFYGIAYGALLVLSSLMMAAYYGRKNFAAIQGISLVPVNIFSAISPVLAGFIFDNVGSYFIPLTVATFLCAIGGICAILAKAPHPSAKN